MGVTSGAGLSGTAGVVLTSGWLETGPGEPPYGLGDPVSVFPVQPDRTKSAAHSSANFFMGGSSLQIGDGCLFG